MYVMPEIGVLLVMTLVLAVIAMRTFRWEAREIGMSVSSYQTVIVGGGWRGGMIAQEYREQGGTGRS